MDDSDLPWDALLLHSYSCPLVLVSCPAVGLLVWDSSPRADLGRLLHVDVGMVTKKTTSAVDEEDARQSAQPAAAAWEIGIGNRQPRATCAFLLQNKQAVAAVSNSTHDSFSNANPQMNLEEVEMTAKRNSPHDNMAEHVDNVGIPTRRIHQREREIRVIFQ